MAFFDFLSSPGQDVGSLQKEQAELRKKRQPQADPFSDDEGLRLSQFKSEGAQAAASQSLTGASAENERRSMANASLKNDLPKAIASANAIIDQLPGRASGTSTTVFREVSDETRNQIKTVANAIRSGKTKVHPLALADDFERLAQNKEFLPQERNAMAGVAAMFRTAADSAEVAKVKEAIPPIQPSPESVAQAQDKIEALRRQEVAARSKLDTLGTTNPQRAGVENSIIEIAKEREGLVNLVKKYGSVDTSSVGRGGVDELGRPSPDILPENEGVVTNYMKGLGVDRDDLMTRVHSAMVKVGIPADQWGDRVDPRAAVLRVLGELDPQGTFAAMVAEGISKAKAEDSAGASAPRGRSDSGDGDWKLEMAERSAQGREQRLRMLYEELRQSPFMSTWPGVILYVLVGLLTQNPAFAARLVGGIGNREAADREIKGIQNDLSRLDREIEWRERLQSETKREAARRMTKQEDTAEQRKWELSKMMLNHNLIIQRNEKKGNPETAVMKKLSAEFNRSLGIAAKYSKTKDDPFASDAAKAEAKTMFDKYVRKAMDLDATLQELGGTAEEEVTSGVDEE